MNQNIAQQNGTQPKFREMGLAWVWVEYLELSIRLCWVLIVYFGLSLHYPSS